MSGFQRIAAAAALLACVGSTAAMAGDGLVCQDRISASAVAESEGQAQKLAWYAWQSKVAHGHGSKWTESADADFEAFSCSMSAEGIALCIIVAKPCAKQTLAEVASEQ